MVFRKRYSSRAPYGYRLAHHVKQKPTRLRVALNRADWLPHRRIAAVDADKPGCNPFPLSVLGPPRAPTAD